MDETPITALLRELADELKGLADDLRRIAESFEPKRRDVLARDLLRRGLGVAVDSVASIREAIAGLGRAAGRGESFRNDLELLLESESTQGVEHVEYDWSEPDLVLTDTAAEGLLAVAGSAIAHLVRGGNADRLVVRFGPADGRLRLVVADQGSGFAPDDLGTETEQLVSMRREVRALGGEIALETSWREGIRIVVTVPEGAVAAGEN